MFWPRIATISLHGASQYEAGFNPSLFTALGGFTGLRAAAKHALGRDDLTGVRVAVQGLGQTGGDLCRHGAYIECFESCRV